MTIEFSKEIMPVFVVIISAILAFIFGKQNEKNKKLTLMSEESLNSHISLMYNEIIGITNVSNYNVKKIKKFIITYSFKDNLYKVYEEEINFVILDLSIKIRTNTISNHELVSEFRNLSKKIEKQYWNRLRFSSSELKWAIKKKIYNKWYSVPLNILFISKDFIEYFTIISVVLSFFSVVDYIANGDEGAIRGDLRALIFVLTLLFVIIYLTLMVLYYIFSNNKESNRKKLIV